MSSRSYFSFRHDVYCQSSLVIEDFGLPEYLLHLANEVVRKASFRSHRHANPPDPRGAALVRPLTRERRLRDESFYNEESHHDTPVESEQPGPVEF